MDPSDDCATPRSGSSSGSGSGGKGGRSANTSSRRRLVPSSPRGTQLMLEFDAAGDAGGSAGSSSSPPSSGALDLEGVLLLDTPVATDNTIIMEGALLDDDDEPGTHSGPRRSASLVDNSGLGAASCAARSTFVGNNGPSNRVSISDLDLVLVSGYQGSSGGGSGGRRIASNDQFPQREEYHGTGVYVPTRNSIPVPRNNRSVPRNNRPHEVGSSSRQQAAEGQGQWQVGLPNIQPQHQPQFPPLIYHRLPVPPLPPPPPSVYVVLYEPRPSMHPAFEPSMYPEFEGEDATVVPARSSSGRWPPAGVTIKAPPGSDRASSSVPTQAAPEPQQPARPTVTIRAPPGSDRPSSSAPTQPEALEPEQLEALLTGEGSFTWPPTEAEHDLFNRALYGIKPWWHRPRARLSAFQEMCSDDEPLRPPPPLPPLTPLPSQRLPPPPGSQ